ncbi:MAG: hypothetical protein V4659_02910 [Pseudomonadota bacterium]
MAPFSDATRATLNPVSALGRLPTGAKLFLIVSAALLPLALIALFATLQTTRTADMEARAQLRLAAAESARAIAIELVGDITALRTALNALDDDPRNATACARARGVFVQQAASAVRFTIGDRSGRILCGQVFPGAASVPLPSESGVVGTGLVPDRGVVLTIAGRSGATNAAVLFPVDFLAATARPSGFVQP